MKRIIPVALLISAAPFVFAQSGRVRDGQSDKQVIRLKAEEVLLPVCIRRSDGKLADKLERSDFVVIEDSKKHDITSIERTPASILLLLDAGVDDPEFKRINMNRDLALKVVDSLGEKDQAAIVIYSDSAKLIAPWTSDKQALRDALKWKFRPGLGSHLYDGIIYSANEVLPGAPGLRTVVLMTDGIDSLAHPVMENVRASLHRARATLLIANQAGFMLTDLKPRAHHALGWYEMIDPKVRKRIQHLRSYEMKLDTGRAVLADLVEETGGAMWDPPNTSEFADLNKFIVEEIGTEWMISYSTERPANDTEPHTINVSSKRTDLNIRARRKVYSGQAPDADAQPKTH